MRIVSDASSKALNQLEATDAAAQAGENAARAAALSWKIDVKPTKPTGGDKDGETGKGKGRGKRGRGRRGGRGTGGGGGDGDPSPKRPSPAPSPKKGEVEGDAKPEDIDTSPISLQSLRADTFKISRVLDMKGWGLVEILQRAHLTKSNNYSTVPCGWATIDMCRGAEKNKCPRCKHGAIASPEIIAACKHAASETVLKAVKPDSIFEKSG